MSHGEWDALGALLRRGARLTLLIAAALGLMDDVVRLLGASTTAPDRQRAFAVAAQYGRTNIVQLLLDAGVDPSAYNPPGQHSHSTPLHQAVLAGHEEVVALLLQHGADRSLKDTLWGGTPADWADHGGHSALAACLRESGA